MRDPQCPRCKGLLEIIMGNNADGTPVKAVRCLNCGWHHYLLPERPPEPASLLHKRRPRLVNQAE